MPQRVVAIFNTEITMKLVQWYQTFLDYLTADLGNEKGKRNAHERLRPVRRPLMFINMLNFISHIKVCLI